MLHRVYDFFSDLEHHQVLLSFKGELTPELVTALLGAVENQMAVLEPDPRLRKRVFNVLMECLQNLYHHKARNGAIRPGDRTEETQGVLMVARGVQGWQVLTGNFMAGAEVERLKDHLERVNMLDGDQLRAFYMETLADGQYGRQGGAGLGIIDIARKSGRKLEYGFVPYDAESAFFSLNVNVNTQGN